MQVQVLSTAVEKRHGFFIESDVFFCYNEEHDDLNFIEVQGLKVSTGRIY